MSSCLVALSGLRIQRCHCCGAGYRCGVGSVLGWGTWRAMGMAKKRKGNSMSTAVNDDAAVQWSCCTAITRNNSVSLHMPIWKYLQEYYGKKPNPPTAQFYPSVHVHFDTHVLAPFFFLISKRQQGNAHKGYLLRAGLGKKGGFHFVFILSFLFLIYVLSHVAWCVCSQCVVSEIISFILSNTFLYSTKKKKKTLKNE